MIPSKFKFTLILYPVILLSVFITHNSPGQTKTAEIHTSDMIAISNGLLSLEVLEQPLIDVVEQIGDLADFEVFVIDESIHFPAVSASLTDAQVELVINRLLENVNYVIYFKPGEKNSRGHVISQIWLVGLAMNQRINNDNFSHNNNQSKPEYAQIKSLNDAVVEIFHDENALSVQERSRVLTGLINILVTTEDPVTKARAAISLGNFKDPRAITTLQQSLAINEPMVRSQAIYALGQIGGDRAIQILGDLLFDTTVTLTERAKAAEILKGFKTEKADYYLDLASNNNDKQIRMALNSEPSLTDEVTETKNQDLSVIEQDQ